MLDQSMLATNVSDAMRVLDYTFARSFVDAEHVGAMGLSFGGTMSLWVSLMDKRIQATDILLACPHFMSPSL